MTVAILVLSALLVAFALGALARGAWLRRRVRSELHRRAKRGSGLALVHTDASRPHEPPVGLLPERADDAPIVRRDEILPPSTFPPPAPEDDSLEAFVRSFPRRAPLVRVARPTRVAFLHGFGGFSELGVGRLSSAYFRGLKGRLHARGIEASFVRVSPFASIMVRAAELSSAIRDLGPGRTHLVAHSMGGLDARFALTHLGLREDVASLVTVATPHAGTPIADVSSYLLRASRFFEQNLGSVLDLTTARMAAFEAETPDVADVQYACVVASPRRGALGVGPWLLPTYSWLRRRAGDNDGVVPVTSQRRGRELGHIDTDHWGSVGWGGFDAPTFYEKLVLDLLEGNALDSSSVRASHRLPLTSASW